MPITKSGIWRRSVEILKDGVDPEQEASCAFILRKRWERFETVCPSCAYRRVIIPNEDIRCCSQKIAKENRIYDAVSGLVNVLHVDLVEPEDETTTQADVVGFLLMGLIGGSKCDALHFVLQEPEAHPYLHEIIDVALPIIINDMTKRGRI